MKKMNYILKIFISKHFSSALLVLAFVCVHCIFPSNLLSNAWLDPSMPQDYSTESTKIIDPDNIKQNIQSTLDRYCAEACEFLYIKEIKIPVESDITELGFEQLNDKSSLKTRTGEIIVGIQIDERIDSENQGRLYGLIQNKLKSATLNKMNVRIQVKWHPVRIPEIGGGIGKTDHISDELKQKLTKIINSSLQTFCPNKCVISTIEVSSSLLAGSERGNYLPKHQYFSESRKASIKIDDIYIEIAIDESIDKKKQSELLNYLYAKTKFIEPIEIYLNSIAFPESHADLMNKQSLEANDPYGLAKLREMLTIFRDLAGTKEIITTTNSESQVQKSSTEKSEASEKLSKQMQSQTDSQGLLSSDNLIFVAYLLSGILILAVCVISLMFFLARKQTRSMYHPPFEGDKKNPASPTTGAEVQSYKAVENKINDSVGMKLQYEEMKNELIELFFKIPRVAKETFGRILNEQGIEATAIYVEIFGQLVVFELLDDPNFQRNLLALSEYYHSASIDISIEDRLQLLIDLKRKFTANKIKVLASRTMEKFDFLSKLDPKQLFKLLEDESSNVIAIVMTQLSQTKRKSVFEFFTENDKTGILKRLCNIDSLPKDYLTNVALALEKKAKENPEFNTANIRSTDIMHELLEKSSIAQQKSLITSMAKTDPETCRLVKMNLISVEMIPYLKDSHLLDVVLSLERPEIIQFMKATKDHIRNHIFSKIPEELAESWIEDLQSVGGVDEKNYNLIVMKINSKIRSLSVSGAINIFELNEMIFNNADSENSNGYGDDLLSKPQPA